MPTKSGLRGAFNRAFFWTDERTTLPYDLWVISILAFVWLVPPDWLADPTATGPGLIGLIGRNDREPRLAVRLHKHDVILFGGFKQFGQGNCRSVECVTFHRGITLPSIITQEFTTLADAESTRMSSG